MASPHSVKKAELKPKHRRNLRKNATLLHGLGVNVSEHIEKLEIDENELKEIRAGIGSATFLKPVDRANLKQILTRLYNIMKASVALEEIIWTEIAPFTFAAHEKYMNGEDLIILRAVRELHSGLYNRKATALKSNLPLIRKLILASLAKEGEKIFPKYQNFLNAVEKVVSDLVALELRYEDSTHEMSEKFSKLNREVRELLHEDAHFLTMDIARIYDAREAVYKWLAEADKEVKPHIFKGIDSELEQLISARKYYINAYKQHIKNVAQIYVGAVRTNG